MLCEHEVESLWFLLCVIDRSVEVEMRINVVPLQIICTLKVNIVAVREIKLKISA